MKTNGEDIIIDISTSYPNLSLTKREHFAAMAMQGICVYGAEDAIKDAKTAVDMADALIQALNI